MCVGELVGRQSHPHAAPRAALLYRLGDTPEDLPRWAKVLSVTQRPPLSPRTGKLDAGARTKSSSKKPGTWGASERRMQATEQTVASWRAATQMEVVIVPVVETGQAVAKTRASRPARPGTPPRESQCWREYGTVHSQQHGAPHNGGKTRHVASLLARIPCRAQGPWQSTGRRTFRPAGTSGSDRVVESTTPRGIVGRGAASCDQSQWRCGQERWGLGRGQAKEEEEWHILALVVLLSLVCLCQPSRTRRAVVAYYGTRGAPVWLVVPRHNPHSPSPPAWGGLPATRCSRRACVRWVDTGAAGADYRVTFVCWR